MQDKLQSLSGLGRHYMVLIIGLMLVLVLAGGMYALHEASHYSGDNSIVKSSVDPATGRSTANGTGN